MPCIHWQRGLLYVPDAARVFNEPAPYSESEQDSDLEEVYVQPTDDEEYPDPPHRPHQRSGKWSRSTAALKRWKDGLRVSCFVPTDTRDPHADPSMTEESKDPSRIPRQH